MELEVLLFASLRDRAGAPRVSVTLEGRPTVGSLRCALAARFPQIAEGLASSRIAVDCEFRGDDDPLPRGAEIAVIPPVSGG